MISWMPFSRILRKLHLMPGVALAGFPHRKAKSFVCARRDCDNAQHRKRNALRGGLPAGAGPPARSQPKAESAAPRSEWSAPQLRGGLPGVWGSDLAYHEGALCCEPSCCSVGAQLLHNTKLVPCCEMCSDAGAGFCTGFWAVGRSFTTPLRISF